MRTAFQKQKTTASRISRQGPTVEGVGVLTPVHIDDIVKDRNLDYLQNLGELVQRTPGNPVWYEYESSENKMKFLQIYQLSICYARNTDTIYQNALAQMHSQYGALHSKIEKLKSDILTHKDKTTKLRKQYRKQKLLKEREKALHYERSLKNVRDALHKQKIQLQAQNQRRMRQIQMKQKSKQEEKKQNPFAYLQQFSPPYPYYPYPMPQGGMPAQGHPYNLYEQHQQQSLRIPQPQISKKASPEHIQNAKIQEEDIAKKTDSIMLKQTRNEPSIVKKLSIQPSTNPIFKKKESGELKQSKKSKEQDKNSNKTWTLRNSDNIRQSNIESEKGDVVTDLSGQKSAIDRQNIGGQNSKLSRKSSGFSDAEYNSILNVQLKTESKNDIFETKAKKQTLKKEQSISQKLKNSAKMPEVDEIDEQTPKASKKQSVKIYDNKMSVKISSQKPVVMEGSMDSPGRSQGYGYLQQSNQGPRMDNLFIKGPTGIVLKSSDRIGRSYANSMEDGQSRNGSKMIEQDTSQTRVNLNVDFSESSPEKQKPITFVPLYKDYFMLKNEALGMDESKCVSSIGSLKDFSVKFLGSERKKTFQDKSQGGLDEQNFVQMQQIEMPMNSIIARPSKLKHSTIMKSKIQQKIHKSHDPKAPAEFVPQSSNKKSVKFVENAKISDVDDNFAKINGIQDLKSIKINKKQDKNTLKVPPMKPKAQEKLSTVDIVQSQIIQQNIGQDSENLKGEEKDLRIDENSLNLSIIEQSQNQSLFTQQNSMKQKILLLIDKKYKQKGNAQFNKQIIKQQIESLHKQKKGQKLSYEELVDAFNQLAEKKQQEVNSLIDQRKNKAKMSSKKTSKQNSAGIIKADKKNEFNISQVSEKKQEDDLMYSRSLLQNPNLKKVNQQNEPKPTDSNDKKVQKAQQKNTNLSNHNPKYIRQQKESNNNRMLTKIIESSKYDQDDEIQNTIKNNGLLLKPTEQKQKLDDSF